ncbi:MAG: RusA family crossover junction endodeoxyribonuclease [Trebonia sp.]
MLATTDNPAPRTVEGFVLRVPGPPGGKGRPRFDGRTRRTYTPPATVRREGAIVAAWRDVGEPRLPDDQALGIYLDVVVVRPASHWRRDGTLSAEGLRHPLPRTQKPDLDNAVKLVMDALNGRAYRDDVRVARLTAERMWGRWPETVVCVFAIDTAARSGKTAL